MSRNAVMAPCRTSHDSVAAFAKFIRETKQGKLDVLVNNAGMAYKGSTFGPEEAEKTLEVNYYGTKRVTEALIPFVRAARGRIVKCVDRLREPVDHGCLPILNSTHCGYQFDRQTASSPPCPYPYPLPLFCLHLSFHW